MSDRSTRLEVGRIHKAHGLNGDVVISLSTDRSERLAKGATLWADERELELRSSRSHQDRFIVGFVGLKDRNDADALRGATLWAEPLEDENALWAHELIGATVELIDGSVIGRVESIEANPAHDLLVLEDGTLIPEVFVSATDRLPEVVVVDPPSGLLELGQV